MVGMLAAIMSSTIVNVAVPAMSESFGLSQSRAQWIAGGFMIAMTLALPLTPSLLQRFGLLPTYLGALGVLMTGGLLGAFGDSYALMIAARVIEGLAAGIIQPLPSIVVLRVFSSEERGRAMGVFGLGVVLGPTLGPTLGGWMVEVFGWRSIFLFVVPVGLIAAALGWTFMARRSVFTLPDQVFDWSGLTILGLGLLALQNGLVGLESDLTLGLLTMATGAGALIAFAALRWRHPQPLVQVSLFGARAFALGMLVAFVYGIGLFGSTYLVPIYLQVGLHYAPSTAGAALLPAGLVLAATIFVAGRLADRVDPARLVATGVALLALSMALLSLTGPQSSYWTIVGYVVVGRIGLGLVLPSLTLAVTRELDRDQYPHAVSLQSLMRQLGGAMGVSLVGLLLDWRLREAGLGSGVLLHAAPQANGVGNAGLHLPFVETLRILAGITLASVVAALFMRRRRPRG